MKATITIDLGGEKEPLELTREEAERLRDELNKVLGVTVTGQFVTTEPLPAYGPTWPVRPQPVEPYRWTICESK